MPTTPAGTPVDRVVQDLLNDDRNRLQLQTVPSHVIRAYVYGSCAYLKDLPARYDMALFASVLHMIRRISTGFLATEPSFRLAEMDTLAYQCAMNVKLPEDLLLEGLESLLWRLREELVHGGGINVPGAAYALESVYTRSQQTSFHTALVDFCPGCGNVDGSDVPASLLHCVGVVDNPNADLELHHRPSDGPVDPDLQSWFDFAPAMRPPSFPTTQGCEHCESDSPLSSINIVTDRPPVHLTLGPSFSPAKIDTDAIIKLTVRRDPVNSPDGYDVYYRFESAIAYDWDTEEFCYYWVDRVDDDDDGGRGGEVVQLHKYSHLESPGVVRRVQDGLPTPLRFAALLLEKVSA
ncbi:Signal transduction protein with Nacht domain [Lasiodiplodia theobromae]|uniref:Uncharacterized protein n=1 Tax=Lasiodiplodia theobromae TaxID=45133 RepID=A0A5N5D4W7_9PEZI|nr:Signal transduction protein with Nacht domain [Lasiodiplodia theobromae]KAB2572749.1 hypothetical protein DBV05_g8588 [Lasiodiplodia theobromae]KAF4537863.1 Signal transduction protein with Nacht domain [Lasiodiplodia theobromae]